MLDWNAKDKKDIYDGKFLLNYEWKDNLIILNYSDGTKSTLQNNKQGASCAEEMLKKQIKYADDFRVCSVIDILNIRPWFKASLIGSTVANLGIFLATSNVGYLFLQAGLVIYDILIKRLLEEKSYKILEDIDKYEFFSENKDEINNFLVNNKEILNNLSRKSKKFLTNKTNINFNDLDNISVDDMYYIASLMEEDENDNTRTRK